MSDRVEDNESLYDMDVYYNRFQLYLKNSNEYLVFSQWLDQNFSALLHDAEGKVPEGESFSALAIGCGSGSPDILMLNCLWKHGINKIHYSIVDPSSKLLDRFKEKTIDLSRDGDQLVYFDWNCERVEDYLGTSNGRKYHLITAINMIYYVKDRESVISHLYDKLADGGIMMIMLTAESSGLSHLWKRFHYLTVPTLSELGEYGSIDASDISNVLNSVEIKFKRHRLRCCIKFDEGLEYESEDGMALIEFLLDVKDFAQLDVSLRQEVYECLNSSQCTSNGDGHIDFNNDLDLFVIQK